jgi:hypothetical protein
LEASGYIRRLTAVSLIKKQFGRVNLRDFLFYVGKLLIAARREENRNFTAPSGADSYIPSCKVRFAMLDIEESQEALTKRSPNLVQIKTVTRSWALFFKVSTIGSQFRLRNYRFTDFIDASG